MKPYKTFAISAVVLALAVSSAPAADDPHHSGAGVPTPMGSGTMPMMGQGGMMGGGDMGSMMGGGMGMQMMARHIEGRIAFLKAELKITDAQLPQWNAFAQAMRDNAAAMPGMGSGMGMMNQSGALPDRLAAREKMLSARLEGLRKLKAAADPLYAALSADQKKTADELMISPMGMMM